MKELIQFLNEYQDERKSKFKFSSYDINGSAFIIEKNPRMVLGEETIISKKFLIFCGYFFDTHKFSLFLWRWKNPARGSKIV